VFVEVRSCSHEVVEASLAHSIGNTVHAAYRRGVLFDKRRQLMEAWGKYCVAARAAVPAA
jgi:hypothetical protein